MNVGFKTKKKGPSEIKDDTFFARMNARPVPLSKAVKPWIHWKL